MKKSKFSEPIMVLIFNSKRTLIAITGSLNQAKNLLGKTSAQLIVECCKGKVVMSGNFYFRYLHPNVEISLEEDLGKLDLIQYDKMCGQDRYYYRKDILKFSGRSSFIYIAINMGSQRLENLEVSNQMILYSLPSYI